MRAFVRSFVIALIVVVGALFAPVGHGQGRGGGGGGGGGWHGGGGGWHGGGGHWHGGYCCGVSVGIGLGWGGYYPWGYYGPWGYPYYGYYGYPGYVVATTPSADYPVSSAPAANAQRSPPEPVIYPRNGQGPAQTEADLRDCNRWATTQPNATTDSSVFQRATAACMEGRGYTLR